MKVESIQSLPQSANVDYKCICDMCSCGKHHCPPPKTKGTFETSYNNHYHPIPLAKHTPPNPQYHYETRHYNPQSLKTNYQDNYTPQQNEVKSPSREYIPAKMILHHVPFVGSTSYKEQYKPYAIEPTSNNPQEVDGRREMPAYKFSSPVKFEGVSSYKAQFNAPKVEPKSQQYGLSYQRLQVPFTGSSSYKNDFLEYKIIPQVQQPQEINSKHVKFEGVTSYHDHFQQYRQSPQPSHHKCFVDDIGIPPVNYINQYNHVYYDPKTKKLF